MEVRIPEKMLLKIYWHIWVHFMEVKILTYNLGKLFQIGSQNYSYKNSYKKKKRLSGDMKYKQIADEDFMIPLQPLACMSPSPTPRVCCESLAPKRQVPKLVIFIPSCTWQVFILSWDLLWFLYLDYWVLQDDTECVKVIIAKVGAKGSQNKKIMGKDH